MIARPDTSARLLLLLPETAAPSALRQHLQAEGFDVTLARSTVEALEMLSRLKFGCLVADASLAGDRVPEFVADCLLREPSLAVVVCGAGRDVQAAVRCLHAGAMDYVSDVMDSLAVERAVVEAIARRREALQEQATKRVLREEVSTLVGELRQERARVENLGRPHHDTAVPPEPVARGGGGEHARPHREDDLSAGVLRARRRRITPGGARVRGPSPR
jgi:DNA-binding NtrC family response regulator